jgi:antitoxin component YwqK of YwqJK toxin-antitoxin module
MKNLLLFTALTIIAVGCGKKDEPSATKENFQPKFKTFTDEEIANDPTLNKYIIPSGAIAYGMLTLEDDGDGGLIQCKRGSKEPFTGMTYNFWNNGQLSSETHWKEGIKHGKERSWYSNGKKMSEVEWEWSSQVSEKRWKVTGEELNSLEEYSDYVRELGAEYNGDIENIKPIEGVIRQVRGD